MHQQLLVFLHDRAALHPSVALLNETPSGTPHLHPSVAPLTCNPRLHPSIELKR